MPMFSMVSNPKWSTLKKLIWLRFLTAAREVLNTVTGNAPLTLTNAVAKAIVSLTQTGLCTQASTPTPDAPVDIMTNNGALKFGWQDIITTSQLSGYGTYVSPAQAATTRAYRWFKDLPNGTYTFSVDGDYEIIVQWRDPADPADGLAQGYENLTGWITSGEVTLGKTTGGYGIAVRRTSGTDSITPSNFDGILHVQERGLYIDGTPEVLTVTDEDSNTQTASVPMLLGVGDYKDEAELISGIKTGKVGVKVLDGTGTWVKGGTQNQFYSDDVFTDRLIAGRFGFCTHFTFTTTVSDLANEGYAVFGASTQRINVSSVGFTDVAEWTAWLASQYAAGTPVIVVYPLATETTEQGTAHHLVTHEGTNTVSVTAEVSPVALECEYYQSAVNTLNALLGTRYTKNDIKPKDAEQIVNIVSGETR